MGGCGTRGADAFARERQTHGPTPPLLPGGLFLLRLQFPDQYPDKAPRVKFISEMFHPNIFPDGNLCLDIIQEKWKPIYTVSSILASVQSLLCDPNTESPANADAARLFLADRKAYNKRVRAEAGDAPPTATSDDHPLPTFLTLFLSKRCASVRRLRSILNRGDCFANWSAQGHRSRELYEIKRALA